MQAVHIKSIFPYISEINMFGANISLQCSWDTSVYYVAWYKNDAPIYEEDLAALSVLMRPPQGITIVSDFTMMMSTLTIGSATLDDGGSYTCAVTCGAKGVEFDKIAESLESMVSDMVSKQSIPFFSSYMES